MECNNSPCTSPCTRMHVQQAFLHAIPPPKYIRLLCEGLHTLWIQLPLTTVNHNSLPLWWKNHRKFVY